MWSGNDESCCLSSFPEVLLERNARQSAKRINQVRSRHRSGFRHYSATYAIVCPQLAGADISPKKAASGYDRSQTLAARPSIGVLTNLTVS
jgi:hypothetical protein